jgi:hypothetical protein
MIEDQYSLDVTSLGGLVLGTDAGCPILTGPDDRVGTGGTILDPLLAPLRLNRGANATHALLSESPAIDLVAPAACTYDDDFDPATPAVAIATDGREISRPRGSGCDAGSFERAPSTPGTSCGIGPELVLLTPLLMLAHRRRQRLPEALILRSVC